MIVTWILYKGTSSITIRIYYSAPGQHIAHTQSNLK